MAASNHERVGKALDLLKIGLRPYFEREMRAAYGEKWIDEAANSFRDGRLPCDAKGAVNWDLYALLSVMARQWNPVFSRRLRKPERNLVEELRGTRNDWAHQKSFSTDDTYRTLDSAERLLSVVGATTEAESLKRLRFEVLEELRSTKRDSGAISQTAAAAPAQRRANAGSAKLVAEQGGVSGKYRPLHAHLMGMREDELTMTFEEIESVLGDTLPPSAYNHRAWWGNEDPHKTVLRGKRAWLLAGFKAYPDMRTRRVTFRRGSAVSREEHR